MEIAAEHLERYLDGDWEEDADYDEFPPNKLPRWHVRPEDVFDDLDQQPQERR